MITSLRAVLLAAALAVLGAPPAAASDAWQADPVFAIDPWQLPGNSEGTARFNYRLLDPQGNQIGEVVEQPGFAPLSVIEVPMLPGIYTVEAWSEDAGGAVLRRGEASLRFDDVAPPPPALTGPGRWLQATEPAWLEIGRPPAPLPLSGIRGYAISLDRGAGSAPCAALVLCTEAETDLSGGIGDDSISLGTLPEGIHFARVAAVSGAGVPSPVGTAVFSVDATLPRVALQGLPSGWSNGPVKLRAFASDSGSGMAAAGRSGPFTAIEVDGSAPTLSPGDAATRWVGGSGVHTVAFYARDAAGNVAGGAPEAPPPQTAIVRIDEEPPRIRFAATQDPADPERIEAHLSDALSGPDADRGSIAVRLTGTRARFEELPTRVAGDSLLARWDSDSYPPGKYEFRATGFDAAGNPGTGSDRARGGRMVLVNPLKTQVSLATELSRSRFGGLLRRIGGGRVAGAEIEVTEAFPAGAETRRRTSVVSTDRNGAFSLILEPGPSREVIARFAGTRLLSRATGRGARLEAKTAIRLQASAKTAKVGGKPILFSGRVATAGTEQGAVKGLAVELQFRYRGADWSEFRTVDVGGRGRFRYAYRFSDDDSRGVRFRFRALVKGREGWPFGPGASRPVTVTGR